MKSNTSLLYSFSLVVGDFLALVGAFALAYLIRGPLSSVPVAHPISASTYLWLFFALVPFWIMIFALLGLYNSSIYEQRFAEAGRLLVGSFVGLLFVGSWAYFDKRTIFPAHLVPIYGFILSFLLLLLFRNVIRGSLSWMFRHNKAITNILIVGNTRRTVELLNLIQKNHSTGYRIVGVVADKAQASQRYPHIHIFESFEEAIDKLRARDIHSIVQTELFARGRQNNEVLEYAQTHHIAYRFIPGNSELFVGNIDVELFRGSIPVIAVHQTALIGWGRIIKRGFDLVVASLLLILLSPVIVLVTLLILIMDPGPIIFRQKRITRFNNRFGAYKFRTMKRKYSGREPVEAFKLMGRNDLVAAFQKAEKLPEDPRVSLIGRFLRRFSIDELPQLLNVIKGDISLVGPRAVIEEELKFYGRKSPMLLSVKTGITGLAQVSGRSSLDYYERAKLDLYYVQNWSFWMDIMILIKTFRVVLGRSGVR